MNKKYPEMRQLIAKSLRHLGTGSWKLKMGREGENGADKDIHPADTLSSLNLAMEISVTVCRTRPNEHTQTFTVS